MARWMLALATLTAAIVPLPAAAAVSGDYVEVRTADVWTGPCFANSQVNLDGKEAILAWRVTEGSFDGVPLSGLAAAAVVEARATLGDPHESPYPARVLLLVDERATDEQRRALAALVRSLAGPLVSDAVGVKPARIEFGVGDGPGLARLEAGGIVRVETRPLGHHDAHCGNEEVYYPPLTTVEEASPAVAVVAGYTGSELGTRWQASGTRGAFVGKFRR